MLWKEGPQVRETCLEVQAFLRLVLMLDARGEILLCVPLIQYFKRNEENARMMSLNTRGDALHFYSIPMY